MICERAVSLPTLVALKRNDPEALMVAPITSFPSRLVTGMDSPVIIASSTADSPETTRPSTGIFSPGRTTTTSPATTSSTGTSTSSPPRTPPAALPRRRPPPPRPAPHPAPRHHGLYGYIDLLAAPHHTGGLGLQTR